jgi:hypothetical protein
VLRLPLLQAVPSTRWVRGEGGARHETGIRECVRGTAPPKTNKPVMLTELELGSMRPRGSVNDHRTRVKALRHKRCTTVHQWAQSQCLRPRKIQACYGDTDHD